MQQEIHLGEDKRGLHRRGVFAPTSNCTDDTLCSPPCCGTSLLSLLGGCDTT
jgi:hypothetical protein